MAQAEVGALRVRLGLDAGEFSSGLKNAESTIARLGAVVGRHAALMQAAVASALRGLSGAFTGAIDSADKLNKLAQAIGVPIEQLSQLQFAADLSDVSLENLARSVTFLSRQMSTLVKTSESDLGRAFQALNINVRNSDGTLRSSMDVMMAIADRFAGMEDGAGKTALAVAMFGRAGAAMVPLLNQGGAGIRSLMQEADRLGLTLTAKTGASAEAFNDNMRRLGAINEGIARDIAGKLLPTMQQLSQMYFESSKNATIMRGAGEGLVIVFKALVSAVVVAVAAFGTLVQSIKTTFGFLVAIATLDWSKMQESLQQINQTALGMASVGEQLKKFWSDVETVSEQGAVNTAAKTKAPIVKSSEEIREALRKMKDEAQFALDEILQSPTEPIARKMEALNQAVRNGTITWRQYGQSMRQVNDDSVRHMTDLASNVASTLTAVFKKSKVAAIASAIINTAVGITQALRTYPPPISFAMAALQAAAGAAQIAAIKGTNENSASGPAPSVSNGGGEASAAAAAPAPAPQTLMVQGIDPSAIFSGDVVRSLAQRLLAFQRDGGQVVLA